MKKTLAMLLVLALVISVMPVNVFAAADYTISFETTFTEDMSVGDTFTVTASLNGNPGVASVTLSLDWNADVVSFTGFDVYEDGFPVSEVFEARGWTVEANQNLGIIGAMRTADNTSTGTLFTANFEIVGSGELGIELKDLDATEFLMRNVDGEDIAVEFDYSAIENLSVAGSGDEGPVIPEGAPFTAITTDAGAAIAIEQQEDVEFSYAYVPYYIVTIPEDAATVYVTDPNQVVMEDYTSGEMKATAYAADIGGWSQLFVNYDYAEVDGGIQVTIPMNMTAEDWSVGTVEMCFVDDGNGSLTHAYGSEDASYACTFLMSFKYAEGGGEETTTYNINIAENIIGGTVSAMNADEEPITKAAAGDMVHLKLQPDEGYKLQSFTVTDAQGALGADNGVFTMPASDVTISATFTQNPPTTYAITVSESQNGTVTAAVDGVAATAAAAGKTVTLTPDPADGYMLDTLTVMNGETPVEVTNNTFTMPAGTVTVTATFKVKPTGYFFATSADVSADNGGTAVVHVKITGHSDENVTDYNAYDVTLTFDDTKLEYVGYDGAVKSDNGSVTVNGNTIRIVGCGALKGFDTEIAALTFKTKAEGEANVTISKVQVSDQEEAVKDNAPEASAKHDEDDTTADTTPEQSVIVVPYSVDKPDFISGNDKVLHGETYTFSYTDTTNYTYSGLKVTVGGTEVIPTEANGVYTIENVNGIVVIEATQTANSYDVTKPENVTGPDKAIYGTDYVFTVTPDEDMAIESVTVTTADGAEIPYTINENGEYVIKGTDISGAFEITVNQTDTKTTITFSGVAESEVEGGLVQTAEIGKDFTFKLNKEAAFSYTVKVGDTELNESTTTAGQYTIPADLVVKGGVTVTITKADTSKATVEVTEYISLDGKVMFLVTAKWRDKVLAYGDGNTMFWSSKYTVTGYDEAGAYCWLVVSTEEMNTIDQVKAAAEAAIVEAAEGVTATAIGYDYDINETTKVDVNDAQLAYDMYNASYMEFTENLPMLKFLEADMTFDSKLDVNDVAAIINYIVNGAAN